MTSTARTYPVTAINLKAMPLGEADRLLTVLTAERGLQRVVAPGARKPRSKIGGRSQIFTINQLMLARGRNLDRIVQAETVASYPGLGGDLGKLAAGQYWAELVLCQALSDQPQSALFCAFVAALDRLDALPSAGSSPREFAALWETLCIGIFTLLTLAGLTPQTETCGLTQRPLFPRRQDPRWRAGFCAALGGTVDWEAGLARGGASAGMRTGSGRRADPGGAPLLPLSARELALLQSLPRASAELQAIAVREASPKENRAAALERAEGDRPSDPLTDLAPVDRPDRDRETGREAGREVGREAGCETDRETFRAWVRIEQALRQYAQYHFGKAIRSAVLLDPYACRQFPNDS